MDDAQLLSIITTLESGDNPQGAAILKQLYAQDPDRALRLAGIMDARKAVVTNLKSNFLRGNPESAASDNLAAIAKPFGELAQRGYNLAKKALPYTPIGQGAELVDTLYSSAKDVLDPLGRAEQSLNSAVPEVAPSLTPATALDQEAQILNQRANQAALLDLMTRAQPAALDQETQALNRVADTNALVQNTQAAYEGLLLDNAAQQGVNVVNQLNRQRLLDTINLTQTPQVVENPLATAAAAAQPPAITGNPSNLLQTVPLTQRIAPQVTVPDNRRAVSANIRQRAAVDTAQQRAEEKLRQQQLRELEIAMRGFQTTIAEPILRRQR